MYDIIVLFIVFEIVQTQTGLLHYRWFKEELHFHLKIRNDSHAGMAHTLASLSC